MSKKSNSKSWKELREESNYKHLDVIVSSGEIRKLFFTRCKEFGIDPIKVAQKAGFTPGVFNENYIKNPDPICKKSFDQRRFIKMLELVGIDIKILVKPKPYSKAYVQLVKNGLIK